MRGGMSAVLEEIDCNDGNRSAFLGGAARLYLAPAGKSGRNARDAAILDRCAEYLNKEAADVLEYQGLPA